MKPDEALRALAAAHGIAAEYRDVRGRLHEVPASTLSALLAAMDVPAQSDADIARSARTAIKSRESGCMAPMTVLRTDAHPWRVAVCIPSEQRSLPLTWRVREEGGTDQSVPAPAAQFAAPMGSASEIALDVDLAPGYYEISLTARGDLIAAGTLAVAPPACYRPPSLHPGRRAWGIAVQLYGVRSARNWGIGDFTDLATLVDVCAVAGADVLGVNPLHALRAHDPSHASPYSPSSRLFASPLYLDVEALAEFEHCAQARALVRSPAFQDRLATLRAAPLVDYAGTAAAKVEVLRLLYAQARRDAATSHVENWTEFEAFKRHGGTILQRHALFEAIQASLYERDAAVWGSPVWPEALQLPSASAVLELGEVLADEVDYHAWLQWQADQQRERVSDRAARAGLAVGLYADLAVSAERGGAESWTFRALYAGGASIGAPPDEFSPNGQDWGLPPPVPQRMRDSGYAAFIATLRANMRSAGALRIDHAMGLLRLYWVPSGASARDGAYVHYPIDDLVGLLALESHRHRCLIIGEDLGTVPDEIRRDFLRNDILSYRVLWFERDDRGAFVAPDRYPEAAIAVATTHDLPTVAAWWTGLDIALRAAHGLLGPDVDVVALRQARVNERGQLLAALGRAGLLPPEVSLDPESSSELTPALADAVQAYVADSRSVLMVTQLEDVFGVREQVNLPGTTDQYANWQRKLPVALEDYGTHERWRSFADLVKKQRSR